MAAQGTNNNGTGYTRRDFEHHGKKLHEAVKYWESTGELPVAIGKDLKKLIINFMVVADGCITNASRGHINRRGV